jgi:LysM repeat protein
MSAQAQKTKRMTKEEYIIKYNALAIKEMNLYGIPASITLAQGLLETDNGNSDLAQIAKNHFGIKCKTEWIGQKYYKDDDEKGECFRVYDSDDESYRDHSLFLKTRSRYAKLFTYSVTDYKSWAYGLKECGYATNPNYPQLLIKYIESNKLNIYDSYGSFGQVAFTETKEDTTLKSKFIPYSNPEVDPKKKVIPNLSISDSVAKELTQKEASDKPLKEDKLKANKSKKTNKEGSKKLIDLIEDAAENSVKVSEKPKQTVSETTNKIIVANENAKPKSDSSHKPKLSYEDSLIAQNRLDRKALANNLNLIEVTEQFNINLISDSFKIPVDQLAAFNELDLGEQDLKIGQNFFLESKKKNSLFEFHIVKPGQTIYDISQIFGVKSDQLRKLNNLKPYEQVMVDEVLNLRKQRMDKPKTIWLYEIKRQTSSQNNKTALVKESATKEFIHKVNKGETIFSISKKYKVEPHQISSWNNLGDAPIKIGQDLLIKSIE